MLQLPGYPGGHTVIIGDGVTSIESFAFSDSGLKDVYYGGNESQWEQIDMEKSYNSTLPDANIHYNNTGNRQSYNRLCSFIMV